MHRRWDLTEILSWKNMILSGSISHSRGKSASLSLPPLSYSDHINAPLWVAMSFCVFLFLQPIGGHWAIWSGSVSALDLWLSKRYFANLYSLFEGKIYILLILCFCFILPICQTGGFHFCNNLIDFLLCLDNMVV